MESIELPPGPLKILLVGSVEENDFLGDHLFTLGYFFSTPFPGNYLMFHSFEGTTSD